MSTVVLAVGARPNFVKMAPVIDALGRRGCVPPARRAHRPALRRAHVGGVPRRPRAFPSRTSSSASARARTASRPARALMALRARPARESAPTSSSSAATSTRRSPCALAAAKLGIPVAHVESGLRSVDWTMPEEINRVLTDRLSELLFTHSPDANDEPASPRASPRSRIHFVGNTMIDSLRRFEQCGRRTRQVWATLGAERGDYALVTLHRPSNVDAEERLRAVVDALAELGRPHAGALPRPPAHAGAARRPGRPRAPRAGRRRLPRAARLPGLPLARVRRGRDRHGLGRHAGRGRQRSACRASPSGRTPSARSRSARERTP